MQGDEIFMDDKGMVLFCIDISGSMGTAVEVEGQINFPLIIALRRFSSFPFFQFLFCFIKFSEIPLFPNFFLQTTVRSNRPSRMQAAVYHQLEVMRERVPNSHPGVVTFGTAVEVMFKLGEEYVKQAQLPTSKSIPTLLKLIETITTEGMMALGPGVVFSLGMASKYPGSKLMVCTDGAANVGCGKVGGKKEQEKQEVHPILFEKFDTGMIQTKP